MSLNTEWHKRVCENKLRRRRAGAQARGEVTWWANNSTRGGDGKHRVGHFVKDGLILEIKGERGNSITLGGINKRLLVPTTIIKVNITRIEIIKILVCRMFANIYIKGVRHRMFCSV